MDVAKTYDELADQYHLIFENWELSMKRQAAILSSMLHRSCGLTTTARILDCACGIGTQSLGLARSGFQVTGCDLSPRSVARARLEASRRNLNIQFSVADMMDLKCLEDSQFDAVICMDNALPHLEGPEQLLQAAEQMRSRLRPGGFLMASIRDYDRLLEQKPTSEGPSFYSDQGNRRIVFQIWDWLDDRQYVFHLYITRQFEDEWQTFHAASLYRAIRREELSAILIQAGFKNPQWLAPAATRFYQPIVLAQAA